MLPVLSFAYVRYGSRRYSEIVRDGAENFSRNAPSPYLINAFVSQFSAIMKRTAPLFADGHRKKLVLTSSNPTKIGHLVVGLIEVLVVDLVQSIWIWNEGRSHQSMHKRLPSLPLVSKEELLVATTHSVRVEEWPPRFPIDAPRPAQRANFKSIRKGGAMNWLPHLFHINTLNNHVAFVKARAA